MRHFTKVTRRYIGFNDLTGNDCNTYDVDEDSYEGGLEAVIEREVSRRGGFAALMEPVEGDPHFNGYHRIVITVGPEERAVEPGTVSHGTLRLQDLIPTFLIFLTWLDPARHERLTEEIGDAKWGLADDNPWWHSSDAAILLDELFDILDEYSPDGYSFGAHEGDGSDFGYWEAA